MTNLFKIEFDASGKNTEEQFKLAFNDIYALSKLLCGSKNKKVIDFISSPFGKEANQPPWLSVADNKVIIFAECQEVTITKNDCNLEKTVEYDFGKRLPADDIFLFAVMSIIKHYIPTAKIFEEVDIYNEEFDDGVLLARVVNREINNPYRKTNEIYNTKHTKSIGKICDALRMVINQSCEKELPIGISDYRELIEYKNPITKEGYLYVDKSLFIREIIADSGTKVIVLTRPRRFGKTLNLSMLQHFYAAEVAGKTTAALFNGLEISKHPECLQLQGKYPVIFISFKDVKQPSFELCIRKIKSVVAEVYREHRKEISSDKITKDVRIYIDSILEQKSDIIDLEDAIKRLLEILCQFYNETPILLIDEYDTPIQEAYVRGYYDELMPFFRNFLSGPLKDESLLKRAILTGILRVSKESLFSGLSNVQLYSVLNEKYSNSFGFTEDEVNDLLIKAKLPVKSKQTKEWYNGYNFAGTTIYNPWSIIEFIKEKGKLKGYWVNTSGNELIRQLIINSGSEIKDQITTLISGNSIKEIIDEHIVFGDLDTNPSALWNLFLMSGYLKAIPVNTDENEEDSEEYELSIPNKEIDSLYRKIVRGWLSGARGLKWYREFLNDLVTGKVVAFEEKLQILIIGVLSYHDVTSTSQESFYHGLMLGLVVGLKDTHEIRSNKESGFGRYDVAIIPKELNKLGIVMEFKAIDDENKLEDEAKIALKQINKSNYIIELKQRGVINICKIGIAFAKKAVRVVTEQAI